MAVGIFRQRRAQLIIAAVTLVVVIVAAGSWMGTLRAELEFDGAAYEPGKTIHFSLTVCSKSVLPMSTDHGKPSWQITKQSGEVVADSSHQVFILRQELRGLSRSATDAGIPGRNSCV